MRGDIKTYLDQVSALYGWSIKARNLFQEGKVKETLHLLRQEFSRQARTFSWRGIKNLPEILDLKTLRKHLESARAASKLIISSLNNHLAEIEYAKKKGRSLDVLKQNSKYLSEAERNFSMMIDLLRLAQEELKENPLEHYQTFNLPQNFEYLIQLLKGEGPFKGMDINKRADIIHYVNLSKRDFSGLNLKGALFANPNMEYSKFEGTNLEEAFFEGGHAYGVSFKNANLKKAKFQGTNLTGAVFTGADLEETEFINCEVMAVNFQKVKNLTKALYLHTCKNLRKAYFDPDSVDHANHLFVRHLFEEM